MTRSEKDRALSERARYLIESQLGERGRFAMLEEMSGINIGQWKNFFYGRQLLNAQMLEFLQKKYPHDANWLLTGERPLEQKNFPFSVPVPAEKDCQTVAQRLNWVIREWASPRGKDLFNYLSKRSGGHISADDWSRVVLGLADPTVEMVAVVCTERPHFTEWVILGGSGVYQVTPNSQSSVAAWKGHQAARLDSFAEIVTRAQQVNPKHSVKAKTTPAKKSISPQKKHGSKKG